MARTDFIKAIHEGRKKLEEAGVVFGSKMLAELRADREQPEPPALLVFANDHSAACTCLACVAARIGFQRR